MAIELCNGKVIEAEKKKLYDLEAIEAEERKLRNGKAIEAEKKKLYDLEAIDAEERKLYRCKDHRC